MIGVEEVPKVHIVRCHIVAMIDNLLPDII